jgi:glycerophosphoryl diester phosphodiesterase
MSFCEQCHTLMLEEQFDPYFKKYFCNELCQRVYYQYRHKNRDKNENVYDIINRTGGYPVICSHRGGGFEFGPENTMYCYKKSIATGKVRILEIDIWLTKDGHLVLMHWPYVNMTTNGYGKIANMTLEEIRKLDAAYHYKEMKNDHIKIPTLKEFLDTFVPIEDVLFMLDFKDEDSFNATIKFIEPYDILHRILLGSVLRKTNHRLFEWRKSVGREKTIPICTDILQTFEITIAHFIGLLHHYTMIHDIYGFIMLPSTRHFFTKALVDAIHQKGGRVLVCGEELNKEETIKKCIDFGVDYIMVDQPDHVSF